MIEYKPCLTLSRRGVFPLFAVVVLLLSTTCLSSVWADTEIAKITAGDSFRGSRFAQSVSISNDVAVIGASEENDRFSSTGAAYIYRRIRGDWQREARLVLANRGSFDRFGWSVATSGNVVVVGSNGSGQQVAVIYQFDGARWIESTTLRPPRAGVSGFGRNVAVSADVTIVGARYSTTDGVSASGAAFIYRFDGTTWQQEAELTLDASRGRAQFGLGVAIHDDLAVVGAPASNSIGSQGSVHVYRFDGARWVVEAELTTDDDVTEDHFGTRVAVENNVIVVGSPQDDPSGEDSGSAYVFRFDGSSWSQDVRLNPTDGGAFEYFGSDVAVSDDVVIVGAPGDDDNGRDSGSVYEFRYDGSNWNQASKLVASDASEIARLGGSVSISADSALIGASGDDENGFISGAAYTFDIALDTDGDGLSDVEDNCPRDWNPLQEDFDRDLLGDVCDQDDDNDGLDDDQDPAPYDALIASAPIPFSPVGNNVEQGVDFEWAAVSGANIYAIEVQHDGQVRAYESMITATTACSDGRCRYVKPDATRVGVNRWRLRAGFGAGITNWSPWAEFVVNGDASPIDEGVEPVIPLTGIPELPQPVSPSGSVLELGVDFRWSPVPGATHYAIEVQHNGIIRGYASMLDAELFCTSEECVYIKSDAALLGNNRWRLKAGNAIGTTVWTTWMEFTVGPSSSSGPTIPALPVPTSPAGSLVNPVVDYQWRAIADATRYVIEVQHNGEIRSYDEMIDASTACSAGNCRYSKPDAALVGENRWRLRAGNTAGFSDWSDWQNFIVE